MDEMAEWMQVRTRIARHRRDNVVATAMKMIEDADAQVRRQRGLCLVCYYAGSTIAGQAFTDWTCRGCGARSTHANTNAPVLCVSCSESHAACHRCGASLDMREEAQGKR